MLQSHPHVKYIRICEKVDAFGRPQDVLIVDTDLHISKQQRKRDKDVRLIDLALDLKEFQTSFRDILGPFHETEIRGVA